MSIRCPIRVSVLSLSVALAGVARAQDQQPPIVPVPDPVPAPAPAVPDAPVPVVPDAPVPVPAPTAAEADRRALPAYRLHLGIDLPVIGALSVITVTRLFKSGSASCAPLCDPADVNPIDRPAAGLYDTKWQLAADVGLYTILAGTAATLFVDETAANALNDATVVTESILAAAAISSMLTLQAERPRPLLYSEKAPLSRRNGPDSSMSFLSGHAAVGFAATTSLFITLHRLHPQSAGPWVALAVGTLASSFIAVSRTLGGNHFPSDNALAAVAGVAVGVLFPCLHGSPASVVPVIGESQRGLALQSRF